MEDLSQFTGEAGYKKAPILSLNQIALNGKDGTFIKKLMLEGKGEDGKYQKQDLGNNIEVVFLKHRRRLFKYNATTRSLETNEHNTKADHVILYGTNEKGTAEAIREAHPELRTQQIVYAILVATGEVVRILVKGASLGSEKTAEGVMKYYDYLGSFGDEHSYQYKTIIKPIKEDGNMGSYYCMSFIRGEKLTEQQLEKVATAIKETHASIVKMDEYYRSKNPIEATTEIDAARGVAPAGQTAADKRMDAIVNNTEVDTIEYPDDEINLEDIPF